MGLMTRKSRERGQRERRIIMKRDVFRWVFPVILSFLLIQWSGCSTTKSVYRKVMPGNGGLRKRVLVLPVINHARVGDSKAAQITTSLINLLKKEGDFIVQKGMKSMRSTQKIRSSEFGIIIDPDSAKRAEELGMNAIIMGVLNPFEETTRKIGIWPFRKSRREIEVSMLVNAIDVINGTLFMSHLETRKIKISKDALEWEGDKKKIDGHLLEKVLSRILESQTSAITRALKDQPWYGRIISANQKTVMINAGKDIGLTQGREFDVFGRGESILSVSGKSLYLLGPKVGVIKAVSIMKSHSSTVPLNGAHFSAGQVIKIKN
jgi:hypothetical protein